MSSSPAVSVCIITFNHEKFIRQAVESALAQKTSFDYEIVVGDDASKDATPQILAELERTHAPRLRVHRREQNIGVGGNLATTLSECRGKYIALLEGDDYWIDDEKLQLQHDLLEAQPEYAICFHPVRTEREGSADTHRLPRGRIPKRSRLADLIEKGNYIPTASVMFRNRGEDLPRWYYDLPIGDLPLHVINARHGDIAMIDRVMAVYRLHAGGTFSMIANADRVRAVVRMYECVNDYLDHRFDATIRGTQSYWEAVERFNSGDVAAARRLARVRFAAPPWNRQRLMAGLMAFAPPLIRLIRRFLG
jgi:glycosyltransferase involved in cell wall biosynthesis